MECGPLAGGALALGPGAPLAKAAAGAENAIKPGRPGMLAGLAYQESLFYEMGHTGLQSPVFVRAVAVNAEGAEK